MCWWRTYLRYKWILSTYDVVKYRGIVNLVDLKFCKSTQKITNLRFHNCTDTQSPLVPIIYTSTIYKIFKKTTLKHSMNKTHPFSPPFWTTEQACVAPKWVVDSGECFCGINDTWGHPKTTWIKNLDFGGSPPLVVSEWPPSKRKNDISKSFLWWCAYLVSELVRFYVLQIHHCTRYLVINSKNT